MSTPDYLQAGKAALLLGDMLTAQHWFACATRDGDNVEALVNLAVVFTHTERLTLAERVLRRAARLAPTRIEIWHNLGEVLSRKCDIPAARSALENAVLVKDGPADKSLFDAALASSWMLLGHARYADGDFDGAVQAFSEYLALKPGDINAIDQRAIAMLGCGRYRDGLIDNKVRWECVACHPLMVTSVPEWKGESLEGKSIVVLHEQGFGDTFQFVRYVPDLKRKLGARRVILSVPSAAVDLFRHCNVADEVIAIADMPEGGLETVDYKSPTMTVPAHLDVRIETISGKPYLSAPSRETVPRDGNLRVGLVWAGKPMYAQDRWRSMDLMTLLPLIDIPGVTLFSLQTDERAKDLWQTGLNAFVRDLSQQIKSWSDTARLMADLDLLVSVDTAPAHLAGAMGIPVALMIPEASCWRWLDHSSTTTPWYDSMTLHRQAKQGDWTPVIASVIRQIEQMREQRLAA